MVDTNAKKIDEVITRGVENVLPTPEKLKQQLLSGKKLKVYLGIDPTSPIVHLGHISIFRKLKQFQDLGHEIIVLVGDFTAISGDPDKTETRTILSNKEVLQNMSTYKDQLSRIIKFDGDNPASFVRNSEWLSKLTFKDVVELASHFTVSQLLERDNFQKRLQNQTPIRLHEFLYPLMQGYDSVHLEVDLELGGNDQLFNMMFGRTLLRDIKNKEKFVMTGKIIADSSGKKIGKTTGNAWNFTLHPNEVYGKLMASPDSTIIQCFEQLTDLDMQSIKTKAIELDEGRNPIELKKELAYSIVSLYYSNAEAQIAQNYFEQTFQEKNSTELKTIEIARASSIDSLVKDLGFVTSKSHFKQLMDQGAIEIDGIKVTSLTTVLPRQFILKVGKKNIVKIIIND